MLSRGNEFKNVELINKDMEFALKNEKEKGNIFSVILLKESLHFNQKSYLEKLEDFIKSNLNGKMIIVGRLKPKEMEEELPFPLKAIEEWNNTQISVKDAHQFFKSKNFECEYSKIRYLTKYTYDEFKTFITGKVYSVFQNISDEELEYEFNRLIKGKDEISYYDEVYILSVSNNLNLN